MFTFILIIWVLFGVAFAISVTIRRYRHVGVITIGDLLLILGGTILGPITVSVIALIAIMDWWEKMGGWKTIFDTPVITKRK